MEFDAVINCDMKRGKSSMAFREVMILLIIVLTDTLRCLQTEMLLHGRKINQNQQCYLRTGA